MQNEPTETNPEPTDDQTDPDREPEGLRAWRPKRTTHPAGYGRGRRRRRPEQVEQASEPEQVEQAKVQVVVDFLALPPGNLRQAVEWVAPHQRREFFIQWIEASRQVIRQVEDWLAPPPDVSGVDEDLHDELFLTRS